MSEAIRVAPGMTVPGNAITMRAVRASGPGGQNVNKVSSKIELSVDVGLVEGLDEGALRRLAALAGRALGTGSVLRVTAQESRDRSRNLETAREKVRSLLERALVVPKRRRPTRPRAAKKEERLRGKKHAAALKAARRAPAED
jgi:ribosome-associated protein